VALIRPEVSQPREAERGCRTALEPHRPIPILIGPAGAAGAAAAPAVS
jgi:hypothetical protein